jgi:hypothetical protein
VSIVLLQVLSQVRLQCVPSKLVTVDKDYSPLSADDVNNMEATERQMQEQGAIS